MADEERISKPVRGRAMHALIARRAARDPRAVAVECGAESLTYGELLHYARRLARRLRGLGIGPEVPVGLYMDRSVASVVGLLGILGAGGVYLPLDVAHPAERLAFLLDDARPPVVVTRRALAGSLPRSGAVLVELEELEGEGPDEVVEDAAPDSLLDRLAYIIYTSGSTGRPKATGISHRALARHCLGLVRRWRLTPADRLLQFFGLSFDLSIEQTLIPLVAGATAVLRGPEGWSAEEFADRVRDLGLTMVSLPPAYFGAVAREHAGRTERAPGDRLRLVTSGGERMEAGWVALWRRGPWGALPLVNLYGPTETTITATGFDVPVEAAALAGRVPIGRPFAGRVVYLLGRDGREVTPGEAGELCLGGLGVARGYLGRPELTAERFIPDPFALRPGARLYRTGDLARRPGGDLDFLGRIDDQVKIRGFRIEPGEIEAVLRAHPAVGDAAVVVREDRPGERRLVAYVTPAGSGTAPAGRELRRYLAEHLPAYMVPAAFVALTELPRTPGAKLDRRALPAPGRQRPELAAPYAAPRHSLEERLAGLWAELFEVDRVGIDDPFVELGGHSLLAIQLASRVRDILEVDLPLHNPFAVPTIAELARAIEERRAAGISRRGGPALRPVPVLRGGDPLPLTTSQERIWFLHRMSPESRAYQTQFTVRFRGPLEVPALAGALAAIVRRHEVFRTTFPESGGRPVQEIHPTGPSALPLADLSRLPETVREAEARRLVSDRLQEPFGLERLPMIRWSLVRLGSEDHLLAVVEHHLVHDGWSNNLLLGEMVALYRAAVTGLPSPLPEPQLHLADYAVWQRRWLESGAAAEQLAYWQRTLAGCRPLELPADRPRPAAPSYRGHAPRFDLPAPLCRGLRALARRRQATLFATMLAAFQALLQRYTGEDDLCVGSGVACRSLRETEGLIGMIVNNAVMRTDLSGDPAFEELVSRAMRVAVGAYAHQELPFDRVVEAVRPHRDRSVHPLFQVMLSFHDSAMPELDLPGLEAAVEGLIANGSAKFDLNVIMIPRADQARSWQGGERPEWITVGWEYSSDLFDPPTIERMTGHFRNLLGAVVERPGLRLSELPLLGEAERHQVLAEWRQTEAFPAAARLDELFLRQAAETPDAVAVVCGREALSYGELARRAQEMAADLRAQGVGPEARVALLLDRSLEMVIAVVGVLAAGGAYVPLDPALPAGRLDWLLADAAPAVVVDGERTQRTARTARTVSQSLESLRSLESFGSFPASAAYVIYTSGSTGTPKGVVVSHENAVRLFAAAQERFGFGPSDVWTLFHSYAFDFSVWEIWGPLLHGGRLVIVPELASRSPEELLRLLRAEGVTVLNQTPSAFRQLARARELEGTGAPPLALRWIVFGGEALDARTLAPWFRAHGEGAPALVNMYGITETTVHVTWRRIVPGDLADPAASAVGRPLADLEVVLLDRRGEPVPMGVPGEIHVGGAGLARGYLGRPVLTAERFIPHPWSSVPGALLYRSGDLGRWRPDGDLEHRGRIDHQVKVRGFRIEPGEVEAALAAHPAVAASAVMALPDSAGDHRLTAYIVAADAALAVPELRDFLRQRLPEHMVPSAFVFLDALPLNANGKLDRDALPAPGGARAAREASVAPRTSLEERVAAIWAEVLEVRSVGVLDDFFELGGYSLLAVRLLHRVREVLGVEVPFGRLFDDPTVAGLAAVVAEAELMEPGVIDPGTGEVDSLLASLDTLSQEAVDALLADLLARTEEFK